MTIRRRRLWFVMIAGVVVAALVFLVTCWIAPSSEAMSKYRRVVGGMSQREVEAELGIATHGARMQSDGSGTGYWEFPDGDIQVYYGQGRIVVGKYLYRRDGPARFFRELRATIGF